MSNIRVIAEKINTREPIIINKLYIKYKMIGKKKPSNHIKNTKKYKKVGIRIITIYEK